MNLQLSVVDLHEDMFYDLRKVIGFIRIATKEYKILTIGGDKIINLLRNTYPLFPRCYPLKLMNIMKETRNYAMNDQPLQVNLYFKRAKGFGVTVHLAEKNKALVRRQLKANLLSYVGPSIENMNLDDPRFVSAMIR